MMVTTRFRLLRRRQAEPLPARTSSISDSYPDLSMSTFSQASCQRLSLRMCAASVFGPNDHPQSIPSVSCQGSAVVAYSRCASLIDPYRVRRTQTLQLKLCLSNRQV
jgi:hypothetical protein